MKKQEIKKESIIKLDLKDEKNEGEDEWEIVSKQNVIKIQ